MAVELAELLDVKLHLSSIIPEKLQQESVRKSLKTMMNVVEDTLRFIMTHIDNNSLRKLPLLDIFYAMLNA